MSHVIIIVSMVLVLASCSSDIERRDYVKNAEVFEVVLAKGSVVISNAESARSQLVTLINIADRDLIIDARCELRSVPTGNARSMKPIYVRLTSRATSVLQYIIDSSLCDSIEFVQYGIAAASYSFWYDDTSGVKKVIVATDDTVRIQITGTSLLEFADQESSQPTKHQIMIPIPIAQADTGYKERRIFDSKKSTIR